jgi:hypothetical protein
VSDSDPVGLGLARLASWLSTALHGTGTDLTARLASMNRPQQRVEYGAGPAVHDRGEDSG